MRGEAIVAETRVDNATPEALDNLLSAAEGAGFHRLRLHDARDEYELVLSSERATTHAMLELDDGQLLVSQLPPSEDHGPAWTPGNATDLAQAANWLRDQCRGKPCSLRLSRPRKLSLLDTIRQGVLVSRSTPDLELSMTPHVKFGATSVSGRLPPEAIQRTVREHFEIFKTCYEAGLARNDQLTGRVIARFVIGRDGKVSKVSDGGSDLPDTEVRDCVLKGFYQLEFPAPEGGIVTVIYPILLAPG